MIQCPYKLQVFVSRYLFNCGEGTQRLTSQLSLSRALATLEHVFITSKSWRNLGGLPGLCLSCRAAGAPDITIHGPKGCMDLYEATKAFVTLFEFDVEAHNAEDGAFEDGGVKVETIVLDRATALECPPLGRNWREDEDQVSFCKIIIVSQTNCHRVNGIIATITRMSRPTSVASAPALGSWILTSV